MCIQAATQNKVTRLAMTQTCIAFAICTFVILYFGVKFIEDREASPIPKVDKSGIEAFRGFQATSKTSPTKVFQRFHCCCQTVPFLFPLIIFFTCL